MVTRTGVLENSPLVLTLASVRFTAWALLSKKIDEIHEDLRDILPISQSLQVDNIGPNGQPQGEPLKIWIFMSGDRKRGVQLGPDQVLLVSRHYTRYSEFSKLIDRVLRALMDRMKFMHLTNIGVRYVDAIRPANSETLEQYIDGKLLPPKFDDMQLAGGEVTAAYDVKEKQVRVRCNSRPGTPELPEDILATLAMMQAPAPLQVQTLQPNQAFFDVDALEVFGEPLRVDQRDDVTRRLSDLHDAANSVFRRDDVFTDHAFSAWSRRRNNV